MPHEDPNMLMLITHETRIEKDARSIHEGTVHITRGGRRAIMEFTNKNGHYQIARPGAWRGGGHVARFKPIFPLKSGAVKDETLRQAIEYAW